MKDHFRLEFLNANTGFQDAKLNLIKLGPAPTRSAKTGSFEGVHQDVSGTVQE